MKIAKKVYNVLCEDIREEKGDKLSYLGVYGIDNAGLVVDRIPALLPKLCLVVMLSEILVEINKCSVTVKSPGTKDISLELPPVPRAEIGKNLTLGIAISPFKAETAGKAKIELRFNDEKKPSLTFEFNILSKIQK